MQRREELIAKAKEWKGANPDRYLAGRRAIAKRRYHALTPKQHRDKQRERAVKMTPVERDKRNQRSKEWYRLNKQLHPRQLLSPEEAYRQKLESTRRWRESNPERVVELKRLAFERDPERRRGTQRMAQQRRKARKKSLTSTLTPEQWEAIKVAYDHRCAYCSRKMERLTQDHVTPLSKGGTYTVENIVPACRSCNSRKYTGTPLAPVKVLLL